MQAGGGEAVIFGKGNYCFFVAEGACSEAPFRGWGCGVAVGLAAGGADEEWEINNHCKIATSKKLRLVAVFGDDHDRGVVLDLDGIIG